VLSAGIVVQIALAIELPFGRARLVVDTPHANRFVDTLTTLARTTEAGGRIYRR
jgi:hypothetical protein